MIGNNAIYDEISEEEIAKLWNESRILTDDPSASEVLRKAIDFLIEWAKRESNADNSNTIFYSTMAQMKHDWQTAMNEFRAEIGLIELPVPSMIESNASQDLRRVTRNATVTIAEWGAQDCRESAWGGLKNDIDKENCMGYLVIMERIMDHAWWDGEMKLRGVF
jgi:hypothetical protein